MDSSQNQPHGNSGRIAFYSILICIHLCFLAATGAPAVEFGVISDEEWTQQPPEDFPDISAMKLFDIGTFDLTDRRLVFERHVRIKVFNKTGLDDIAEIHIPIVKKDKLKPLLAHTITPDGVKHEVTEFFEKKIDRVHYRVFTFPSIEDGSIIEYSYKIKRDNFQLPAWYFQSDIYTARSSFTIRIPEGLVYRMLYTEVPILTRKAAEDALVEEDDATEFHLELTNLPPAKDEPLTGARKEYLSKLQVHFVAINTRRGDFSLEPSWADIGNFFPEWYEEDLVRDDKTAGACSDSICEGLMDDLQKVRALYDFVVSDIETIEESDGADKLKDILKDKEALVYEKVVLFLHLLRAQDIDANYVLTSSRDEYSKTYYEMKSLDQFGDALVRTEIDSVEYILNPAAEYNAFPYLPAENLIDRGVLIDGELTKIIDLPENTRKSGTDIASIVHIDGNGDAVCSTTVYFKGYDGDAWLAEAEDSLSERDRVEALLDEYENDFTLTAFDVMPDTESDRVVVTTVLDMPGFATMVDGNLFFAPTFWRLRENPFKSSRRVFPVDFNYQYCNRDMVQVFLPENMTIADYPVNLFKYITGAKYSRKITAMDNMLSVRSDLTVSKPLFVPEEYAGLKDLFDAMSESRLDQISVSPVEAAGEVSVGE